MTPHPNTSEALGGVGFVPSPAVVPNNSRKRGLRARNSAADVIDRSNCSPVVQQEHAIDDPVVREIDEAYGSDLVSQPSRPFVQHLGDRYVVVDAECQIQVGELIAGPDGERADGGSRNDSVVLLRQLQQALAERIALLDREHRTGLYAARNRGSMLPRRRSRIAIGSPADGYASAPYFAVPTSTEIFPRVWPAARALSASGACASSYVARIGTRSVPSSSRRASRCRFSGVGAAMTRVRPGPSPAAPVGEATRPSSLTRVAGTSGA